MNFDGSSDGIGFTGPGLPSGTADRTICAWIRTDTLAVREWSLYSGSEASYKRFNLDLRGDVSDEFRVGYYAGALTTTLTPSVNTWHHVAYYCTSSGGTVGMWLDGGTPQSGSVSGGSINTDTDFLQVGSGGGASVLIPWSGDICEVCAYDVKLANADVDALAAGMCPLKVRTPNLVFYAPLVGSRTEPFTAVSSVSIYGSPAAGDHPRIYY